MISSNSKAKFEDYQGFIDKFEPKKTTDDCMTPGPVYEAVKTWVCNRYGINPENIARPFWPGGDFKSLDYTGKVVVDNPPFSILKDIGIYFKENSIKYFLFAPHLTLFSSFHGACHILTKSDIVYDNGAQIATSFLTNLEEGVEIMTAPDLREAIIAAMEAGKKPPLPSYKYPENVITSAILSKIVETGAEFTIRADECEFVRNLDMMKAEKKRIFGGGYFITNEKASLLEDLKQREKTRREKCGQVKEWKLSEREKEIVERLNDGSRDAGKPIHA